MKSFDGLWSWCGGCRACLALLATGAAQALTLDPDPSRQRRCPDCCPYALLTGGPPGSQGKRLLLPISLRRLAPGNPTQMSAPVPLVHQLFDQLFDRWIGASRSEKAVAAAATRQGIPAIQFLVGACQQGRGPFLDPQRF